MIFKKHISIILAIFLLVSNVGLAFNVHYCDDVVASVTLNSTSNSPEVEKDCCGIVEKESKCCKNKIVKSSDKSDQLIEKSTTPTFDAFIVNKDWKYVVFNANFYHKNSETPTYYCNANAPPLYLLYSQYTFYA
ncbi:hypothetical protein [Flavobacterium sp.]|uniref:HYC_CC_PP family protein n=1 Tax=Flavobacterium sp. TaxID=239 RepID=UPI00375371BE